MKCLEAAYASVVFGASVALYICLGSVQNRSWFVQWSRASWKLAWTLILLYFASDGYGTTFGGQKEGVDVLPFFMQSHVMG
jgi:hypothetical protein